MSIDTIDLANATFEDAEAVTEDKETPTRTRKPRADKGVTRGTRGPRANSDKALADSLMVPWATFAGLLAFSAPTAAAVAISRGESTATALVNIAKRYPKMYKALQKAQTVTDAAEIGQTILLISMGFIMDAGRLPPENPMAQMLGLTTLYQQVHPEVQPETNGHPFTQPPLFAEGVPIP